LLPKQSTNNVHHHTASMERFVSIAHGVAAVFDVIELGLTAYRA
jgi:hypothetical protein